MQKARSWVRAPKLEAKDLIAIPLSVLAFLVSALSLYFSTLRQVDHVSVVFQGIPTIWLGDETLNLPKTGKYAMILVNAGTRPAAITSIALFFLQQPPGGRAECFGGNLQPEASVSLGTDFEPVVVKQNEVLIKEFQIIGPFYTDTHIAERKEGDKTTFVFPLNDDTKGLKDLRIDFCVRVELSTPSLAYHLSHVPISRYGVTHGGTLYGGDYFVSGWRRRPEVLVNQSGTIFGP